MSVTDHMITKDVDEKTQATNGDETGDEIDNENDDETDDEEEIRYPLLDRIRGTFGKVVGKSPFGSEHFIHQVKFNLEKTKKTPCIYNVLALYYIFEKKDFVNAKLYFKKAIGRGNVHAINNLSVILYIRGKKDKAKKYAKKGVRKNNAVSQRLLGCYNISDTDPKKIKKGLVLLKKAAQQKDYDAIFFIGRYYQINEDKSNAMQQYNLLANAGEIEKYKYACGYLAEVYLQRKIFEKAIEFTKLSISVCSGQMLYSLYMYCSIAKNTARYKDEAELFLEGSSKKGYSSAVNIMVNRYITLENPSEKQVIAGLMCIKYAGQAKTRLTCDLKAFRDRIIQKNLLTEKVQLLLFEKYVTLPSALFTFQTFDVLEKNKKLRIVI